MTTTRTRPSSLPVGTSQDPAAGRDLNGSAAQLVAEIEQYLAARTHPAPPAPAGPATAHPLVTKSTAALVDEALTAAPPTPQAPALAAPPRWWRSLPDRVLKHAPTAPRPVTVSEYIGLTALVLESWGWTGQGRLRTRGGSRCIAGAQRVLLHLGYGDEHTLRAAGHHLNAVLHERGQSAPYWQWNDAPGRRRTEVLDLVRAAETKAGEAA